MAGGNNGGEAIYAEGVEFEEARFASSSESVRMRPGVGTYRAGQTWTEPTFANDIASKNASNNKPARALVVLMTTYVSPREVEGE